MIHKTFDFESVNFENYYLIRFYINIIERKHMFFIIQTKLITQLLYIFTTNIIELDYMIFLDKINWRK